MWCIPMLVASNLFMTTAWYWHVQKKGWPLWAFVLVSWAIALPEYWLAVPANRIGHLAHGGPFTAPQLKILQEAIGLSVFIPFTLLVLKETPRWQDVAGIGLIMAGLMVSLSAPST